MKSPKETSGTVKATDKMEILKAKDKMEICHGSVCIGNKTPTHCICPTTKK
jgi:hypothetical protein